MKPEGNPQGKGLVMVLQQIAAAAPSEIRPKPPEQALVDYWCSSLVLSAAFKFRVSPDQTYYLYHVEQGWQLSLISPDEWGSRQPGAFVATCMLQRDMTWKLVFASDLSESARVALVAFLEAFQARATESDTFDELLPDYIAELPYQQRVLASALKRSLKHSLQLAGDNGLGLLEAVVQGQLAISR